MPRRRMSEAARRELMTRQGDLTALAKHPSWPILEGEVERKRARLEKYLLAKLLGSMPTTAINEHEVDYLRGFIQGMTWLVAVPTHAEVTLERFLKAQGIELPKEETVA